MPLAVHAQLSSCGQSTKQPAQQANGAHGLIVWVIAANKGARAFYEQLGGALLVEQPFEWDGMPLVEAGYGFADIDALIRACKTCAGLDGTTVH